jgi:DNA-directed RNA polymerase beta subunit
MPNEHRAIRSRLDFSKIPTAIQIPNLIEVQRRSYERFLQMDKLPSEREDNGLQSVFVSVFPSPTSAISPNWTLSTSPSATGSANAVTSRDCITCVPPASIAAPW